MRRLFVIPVLLLALAACSDDDEQVGAGDDPTSSEPGASEPGASEPGTTALGGGPVRGGEYVATAITDGGVDRPLVDGTELRITFVPVVGEADALPQLTVTAGCNTLGASYDISGDTLLVGDPFGTEMGCDPELMDQDAWLASTLTGEVGWELDGVDLTLTAGTVVFTLVDQAVAAPDAELVGPTWTLDTIIDGETASSVPSGVVASIVFREDTIVFETGCNAGGATYALDGDTVTLSSFGVEEAGCQGTPDGDVEAAMLAVLGAAGQPFTVAVDGDRLSLTAADGAAALGFTAA